MTLWPLLIPCSIPHWFMDVIEMQQRGVGSRSYYSCLFRRPIRFEIGSVFVLLKARVVIRTATSIEKCFFFLELNLLLLFKFSNTLWHPAIVINFCLARYFFDRKYCLTWSTLVFSLTGTCTELVKQPKKMGGAIQQLKSLDMVHTILCSSSSFCSWVKLPQFVITKATFFSSPKKCSDERQCQLYTCIVFSLR